MPEETFTRFIGSFRDETGEIKYEKALSELVVKGEMSLRIDFEDLYAFDADFAHETLTHPLNHLPHFDTATL